MRPMIKRNAFSWVHSSSNQARWQVADRILSSVASGLAILAGLLLSACHPTPIPGAPTTDEIKVQLIHFSDYHAHAIPFYSEHRPDQGGLARTLAYIETAKGKDPNVLALSGGDMWNSGTPAWSDKYYDGCRDWRWLGEHVSVMAFGNHDVDYGWDALLNCQKQSGIPILSGNLVGADGKLLLHNQGQPYVVRQLAGVRIGVFALSGNDFSRLVKSTNLPMGAKFLDPVAAARDIVATLRDKEQVAAVVFIGHQDRESDFAMAQAVPGIDVILGTHSHYKGTFTQIPGTTTYFISPYQYLSYLSHVELVFHNGKLSGVSGKLVRMDSQLPQDAAVAAQTLTMQQELEKDPKYAPLFQVIGRASTELDIDGIDQNESTLGNFVMDIVRDTAQAQLALSSASSFRASIPPGPIRNEDYLTALPYKNKILTFQMTGAQLQSVLDLVATRRGSDLFGVTSGVHFTIEGSRATQITIRKSATDSTQVPLRADATYTVMATDYMANVATGYKALFAQAQPAKDTGKIVNDTVIEFIQKKSPVSASRDSRVKP